MSTQVDVIIPSSGSMLEGNLVAPAGAFGIVVFAHGSGSGRFSRRNRQVARALNHAGLATLLLDLLTVEEEALDQRTAEFRFDIPRLARRLTDTIDWMYQGHAVPRMPMGLFGASTGAAAALIAAADRPQRIAAVVSRGGRPDLAGMALRRVQAPTLLIVGALDTGVIELNRDAAAALTCEHQITIVPGATHLFEEPGTLDQVASLAGAWFTRFLGPASRSASTTNWITWD